tara:strand:- start:18349 stop:19725 length:1377 start_codon:yes stop_codon:yes gene_type:complete
MSIDNKLLKKYNKKGPRYTSYPPATHFSEKYDDKDFINSVINSNKEDPQNVSVYIHIPFCPQICHFCGCTTESGFTKPFLERYIEALLKEIEFVSKYIDKERKLTQIHWGGGTPNAISLKYIEKVTLKIKECFELSDEYEMAIECSPAHLDFKHIELLKSFGFNRISLGIQDFDGKVLDAINRRRPKHPIEKVIKKIHSQGFTGTNIDLVYGLPLQTVNNFNKTIEKAIKLNTDRIVTFSYAHVPSILPRQKILENIGFPSAEEKAMMYNNAYKKFTEAGYVAIGMDHFCRPDDEFYVALKNNQLHRNFQGYCTKKTTGQVYGFGASSISQLFSAYSQNVKNAAQYIKKINDKKTAVLRGYSLNDNEKITRDIINSIMCNYYVDFSEIAKKFNKEISVVKDIIDFNPNKFDDFIRLNLMRIEDEKIFISNEARLYIRNIAMEFDPLLSNKIGTYSKTI